jgi:hypothetical protein
VKVPASPTPRVFFGEGRLPEYWAIVSPEGAIAQLPFMTFRKIFLKVGVTIGLGSGQLSFLILAFSFSI